MVNLYALNNVLEELDKGTYPLNWKFPTVKYDTPDKVLNALSGMRDKLVQFNKDILHLEWSEIRDQVRLDSAASVLERWALRFSSDIEVSLDMVIDAGIIQLASVMREHPFKDGNKRTAFAAGIYVVCALTGMDDFRLTPNEQCALAWYGNNYLEEGADNPAYNKFHLVWRNIMTSVLIRNSTYMGDKVKDNGTCLRDYEFPRLEKMNSKFCMRCASELHFFTDRRMEFTPSGIEVLKFEQIIKRVPMPNMMWDMCCEPFDMRMLLFMPYDFKANLMNGAGMIEQNFSVMEYESLFRIISIIEKHLVDMWSSLILDFGIVKSTSKQSFLDIDIDEETDCLLITNQAKIKTLIGEVIPEEHTSTFSLVIPVPPIKSVLPLLREDSKVRVVGSVSDKELIHSLYDKEVSRK